VSDVSTATLRVIEKPYIEISPLDIMACDGEDVRQLRALVLEPDYRTNPNVSGEIQWYQKGRYVRSGDNFYPTQSDLLLDGAGNTISARYLVNSPGLTASCKSEIVDMKYHVRSRPAPAQIDKKPICAGEFAEINSSVRLDIVSKDKIAWSSSYVNNGVVDYSNYILLSGSVIENYGTGYMPIDLLTYYADLPTCNTLLHDSLLLAPMPNSKILGAEHVCNNTFEQRYSIEHASLDNSYVWSVTGSRISYTKDNRYENVRYIDWDYSGIDTVRVRVVSPEMCVSEDSMIVYVYPSPRAYFSWDIPGAEYEVQFLDSTIQDRLTAVGLHDSVISIEIPYTMYWDFGRSQDTALYEVVYEDRYKFIYEDFKHGYHPISLTVENAYGCTDSFEDEIFVDIQTGLFLPNAFAPGSAAHGVRYFQPKGFNLGKFEIWVYDVWGNLVWYGSWNEADGQGVDLPKWDGRCNGKMLKSDTYIWKIEAYFMDGQKWKGVPDGKGGYNEFGSLMLIR